MAVSVAVLSRFETFQFAAQYGRAGQGAQPLDASTQLFLYSLTDELASLFPRTGGAHPQMRMGAASDFTQVVHAYQTFAGHLVLLVLPSDITCAEDKIRQCFMQVHKILALEMQNPFYRDGAAIESDGVLKDVGAAVAALF